MGGNVIMKESTQLYQKEPIRHKICLAIALCSLLFGIFVFVLELINCFIELNPFLNFINLNLLILDRIGSLCCIIIPFIALIIGIP